MFTGIIEALGRVLAWEETAAPEEEEGKTPQEGGRRLVLENAPVRARLKPGESLAVNGVCLTLCDPDLTTMAFDLSPETLGRSNLGLLLPGDQVNLECPLTLQAFLGGHLVQGHVDGMGEVSHVEREGNGVRVQIRAPAAVLASVVPQGFIAVDGVSLTVTTLKSDSFSVMLIPHSRKQVSRRLWTLGARVNLETDILGKYLLKYLTRFTPLPEKSAAGIRTRRSENPPKAGGPQN